MSAMIGETLDPGVRAAEGARAAQPVVATGLGAAPGAGLLSIGIIPLGLLAYGLYSKRPGFIWVGGVWLAFNVAALVMR